MSGTATTTLRTATLVAVLAMAVLADPAAAAQGHLPIAGIPVPDLNPMHWVGDGLGKVKDVVFGTFKMGAKEIAQLIGTIVLAILDMLVPDWVVKAGPRVIAWIVEIENWGRSGGRIYSSINGLQGTLKWIGIALMTTGGTWSGLRVLAGNEAVEDVIRAWATALLGIVLFRWGWGQATTLTNSITDLLLTQPGVSKGLTGFVAVIGGTSLAASGGLVLPLLMIVAVIVFIGLLAAKTMLLIVGALVYVTGQFAFALRVWPAGHAILRAWWSLAAAVFAIPIAWTLIFAIGGVMIADAVRAGAGGVIEMNAGQVFQSWMLAIAAVMTIVVAIKAAQAIFAMAKMAPLALVSSIGGGGLSAAGAGSGGGSSAGKAAEAAAGGRSAGQAAQTLRSGSERAMDSAATGDTLAAGKQAAVVRTAQAAGTYFGGPAGGAVAGAVAQRVTSSGSTEQTDSAGSGSPPTEGTPGAPGADAVPQAPGAAPMPDPGTVTAATAATPAVSDAAAVENQSGPAQVASTATGNDPEPTLQNPTSGPQPEPPAGAAAPTNGSAPADPATPAVAAAAQAPPPSGAVNGAAAAGTSVAGLPADTAPAAANGSPPVAPAAADRSIAGLPAGDARSAFGTPETTKPATNGNGPQTPRPPAPQRSEPERPQQPAPELKKPAGSAEQ